MASTHTRRLGGCCSRDSLVRRPAMSETEQSASPQSESDMGWNALPDEILLLILSHVKCGVTLLDSVPLVCKRWLRLARDPAAWASVDVTLPNDAEDHALRDAARVILHAPRLRSLHMGLRRSPATLDTTHRSSAICWELSFRLLSAVRRCRAAVRHLILDRNTSSTELQLLWRCREDLRAVTLHAHPQHSDRVEVQDGQQVRRLNLLEMVAALPRLQELRVASDINSSLRYSGELAAGLPALRVLHLDWKNDKLPAQQLLGHVLQGATQSLRHLHFTFGFMSILDFSPLPTNIVDQVGRCTGLRSLRMNAVHSHVLRHLPLLESLQLDLWTGEFMGELAKDALQAVSRQLEPGLLPAVRSLEFRGIDVSHYGRLAKTAALVFATVAAAAPNATSLKVVGLRSPNGVSDVLRRLPRLRDLHVELYTRKRPQLDINIAELKTALRGLWTLERLTLKINGISNTGVDTLVDAAIRELKSSNPGVNVLVSCNVGEFASCLIE